MKLLFLGRRFQDMPGGDKYNQVQLMTMSAVDFLDQWFETDVLKATMSASGIIGTFLGVRSPGTAYVLLHHYMGEIDGAFRAWGFARGGTGAISNAIAGGGSRSRSGNSHEACDRADLVKNAKRNGVVLANGDEIHADVISSSVDPRLTFTKMIEPGNLPDEFMEGVNRYKFRGSSGKVNMALDGLPDFKCLPGVGAHLRGAISSRLVSNTWRRHTTRRNTGTGRAPLYRHGDSDASPIHRSRRRAKVFSPALCSTHLTSSRPGLIGTLKKKNLATTWSTRSPNMRPTSKTSSCIARLSRRLIWSGNGD